MKKIIILIICISILSCISKRNEKDLSKESTTKTTLESYNEENLKENISYQNKAINYDNLNHDYTDNIRYLDSIYGFTPYIAILDTTELYYVSTKQNILASSKIGLIDKNFKVLLPQEYDFIYNPDEISQGLIVTQQGDKFGLFDYYNHNLINPKFDIILPSSLSDLNKSLL